MTLVQIAHYTSPNYTNHPQVNIHCIENMFTVQDFWGTCACPENGFCSENFQASGSRPPQKKFAVHLLQKKLLKKIECYGCACFWEPIRLKRGSVVAHHTRISSSIPRSFSFFFGFNFCQQKIHIHRAMKMQMTRLFWWLWHRSLNRICKPIAKTHRSCFGETMLEKWVVL